MLIQKPSACAGCSLFEGPYGCKTGFVPSSGSGDNGVLIVAEAAGEVEEQSGVGLVGPTGQYLFSQLKRIGIEREGFKLSNVLFCRPPKNKLIKQPYTEAAILHCAPNLDNTIYEHVEHCKKIGKTPTIIGLGKYSARRLMNWSDKNPLIREDYYTYPFWSNVYKCWVVLGPHPSFIMQGNHHLQPLMLFIFQRALDIASNGLTIEEPPYLLDPSPEEFSKWTSDFLEELKRNPDSTFLSYDIETPYKVGKSEDEIGKDDSESDDFTILRCSFCWKPGNAASVRWDAAYLPSIERLFTCGARGLGWNNCPTPDQKVLTADLRWIPAGNLKIGDKLVSFDENTPDNRKLRRFKTGIVTYAEKGTSKVLGVLFSDGSYVKTTRQHPWLISQRNRTYGRHKLGGSCWVPTENLVVGQEVKRFCFPWEENTSKDAGYIAGFFDGEGHISAAASSFGIGACQRKGEWWERVKDLLTNDGYTFTCCSGKREKDAHIEHLHLSGGIQEKVRFMGAIRPQRLLQNFCPERMGAAWAPTIKPTMVVRIDDLGDQEIVKLSVDQKTYVLEGFAAHNSTYDDTRIIRYIPSFNLISLDGMLSWHVVHSALPKSLGFVTPFYWQNTLMWKHLSNEQPAFYNCKDADSALRCWLGILPALHEQNLYPVFERHVLKLNEVLRYMTGKGITLDLVARKEAEVKLASILEGFKQDMDSVVPVAARRFKPYKKVPKDTTGMVQVDGERQTKRCPQCGDLDVKASHFKTIGKKRLRLGETENSCFGGTAEKVTIAAKLWASPLEFKLSMLGLTNYQKVVNHKPIINRKENKPTFDESAIKKLRFNYPKDPLYPLIVDFRESQTLLSRYVGRTQEDGSLRGGMHAGPDGRIRTTYTHNPSTLRLASQAPNLQNLPRPDAKNKDALANLIRNMIVPTPGWILGARDLSGVEAVLVGYEAKDKDYIRLSHHDIHSFYTSHALYEVEKRISANDLPQLSWDDDKLFSRLAEIKKEFKTERNNLYKHLIHAKAFGQGEYGARDKIFEETGIIYDVKLIRRLMDIYEELFPLITKWQKDVRLQAHDQGFLKNAYGYIHRFNHVFRFEKDKYSDTWERKLGDDAEAVLAFLPQSNAAGIIKEAMLRLYFERFEEAGQFMRLTTHDEILWECPPEILYEVDEVVRQEMERPISELPLPSSYNMGQHLWIYSEAKSGLRWGDM